MLEPRVTYLTEFNEHIVSHRDAEVIRDDANDYVSRCVSMLCGKSQRIRIYSPQFMCLDCRSYYLHCTIVICVILFFLSYTLLILFINYIYTCRH